MSSSNNLEDIKTEDPGKSWDQIKQEIYFYAIETPTTRYLKREESNVKMMEHCNSSAFPRIKSKPENESLNTSSNIDNSCIMPISIFKTEPNNEVNIDITSSIKSTNTEKLCKHMLFSNNLRYMKTEDPGKSWDQIKQEINSYAIEHPTLKGDLKREVSNVRNTVNCNSSAFPIIKSEPEEELFKTNCDNYDYWTMPISIIKTETNKELNINFNSIEDTETKGLCKYMSSSNGLGDINTEDPGKSWDQIKQEINSHAIEIPDLRGDKIEKSNSSAVEIIKSDSANELLDTNGDKYWSGFEQITQTASDNEVNIDLTSSIEVVEAERSVYKGKLEYYKHIITAMGITKLIGKGGYDVFLQDCKSRTEKKAKLVSFMEDHGMEGKPTLEKAKKLKMVIDQDKNVAELEPMKNDQCDKKSETKRNSESNFDENKHFIISQINKKMRLEKSDDDDSESAVDKLVQKQTSTVSRKYNVLPSSNGLGDIKTEDPGKCWDQIKQEINSYAIDIPNLRGDKIGESNSNAVPIIKSDLANELLGTNGDKYCSWSEPITQTASDNEVIVDFTSNIEALEAERSKYKGKLECYKHIITAMGITKLIGKGGYDVFLQDCKSRTEKKAKLVSFMEDHGMEDKPNLEKAKKLKMVIDQDKNVAELEPMKTGRSGKKSETKLNSKSNFDEDKHLIKSQIKKKLKMEKSDDGSESAVDKLVQKQTPPVSRTKSDCSSEDCGLLKKTVNKKSPVAIKVSDSKFSKKLECKMMGSSSAHSSVNDDDKPQMSNIKKTSDDKKNSKSISKEKDISKKSEVTITSHIAKIYSPDEYISPLMARKPEEPSAPYRAFTLPSQTQKPAKPQIQYECAMYKIDPTWPKFLIEKLSNRHCLVCNVKLTSQTQAKRHYDGKPHRRGIDTFLLNHGLKTGETNKNSSSKKTHKSTSANQMIRPYTTVAQILKGPELCPFHFNLDCTNLPKMHIHSDGSIERILFSQASNEDIAEIASCLIKYILKTILKAKRNKDKERNKAKKRKASGEAPTDENAIGIVDGRHRRIAYYSLILEKELWKGRRKIARSMEAPTPTTSPLQNELAITEKQIERAEFGYGDLGGGRMTLYFDIHVWQNTEEPYLILVTGKPWGSAFMQAAMMKPMFSLFSSIAIKQLKQAVFWVNRKEKKKKK